MEIKVKLKSVFGVQRIYPVCEKAEIFRKMTQAATLMPKILELIKELGYKIVVVQDEIEI